ncbi:MAG: hypothetical protein KAY24_16430 [Candidatus Eisenbacteria sp.]|nr:hypothetical protein [Candidatus Eisenbacteria bacterium]
MAIAKKGTILDGLSGRVGDLVCRTRGDRTIVSRRPKKRGRRDQRSPKLEKTLSKFQEAVRFAREARHRQAFRSLSRTLRGYSPYHIALQDFLSEPVIEQVDSSAIGHRGGELMIRVSERVAIRSVRVRMPRRDMDGKTGASPEQRPVPLPSTPPLPSSSNSSATPSLDSQPLSPHSPSDPGSSQEKPRVSTPADIFFRHPIRSMRDGTRGEKPDKDERPLVGRPRERNDGAVELRAARYLGIEPAPDEGPREDRVEIWRVVLPRPGEVEIIASDYAGNRAVKALRVGPEMA